MKKFFFAVVALMFMVFAATAITQIVAPQDLYTVKEGDCLYSLEGDYSGRPAQWSRLVELNPFLKNPGRMWVDGKGRTIVLIRPGEQLQGLGELGIIPKPYPITQLRVVAPVVAPTVSVPAVTPEITKSGMPWWFWVLIFLAALLIFLGIAYARMTRNPITAGPAM